jgi:hypothetical protein
MAAGSGPVRSRRWSGTSSMASPVFQPGLQAAVRRATCSDASRRVSAGERGGKGSRRAADEPWRLPGNSPRPVTRRPSRSAPRKAATLPKAQLAGNSRSRSNDAPEFPAMEPRFPVSLNPVPCSLAQGISTKGGCKHRTFSLDGESPRHQNHSFPEKFPVCREFGWRRVQSVLRRQPRSHSTLDCGQFLREMPAFVGVFALFG